MTSRSGQLRRLSRYADPTPSRRASRVDVCRDGAGDVIEERSGPLEEDDDDDEYDAAPDLDASTSSTKRKRGGHRSSDLDDAEARRAQGPERPPPPPETDDPGPQPLTSDAVVLLMPSSRAWDDAGTRVATVKGYYQDTSAAYAECFGDDGEELAELDADFKELLDMTAEAKIRREVMHDLLKAIQRGDQITDAKLHYEEGIAELLQAYRGKTQRQRYLGDASYKEYKEAVWDAWKEEAMPPLTEFIPPEEGDEEDEDDFAIGGTRMEYKCPLTMALLEEPVTNPACRHSYSKAPVMEYIATQRRHDEIARCPRSGCDKRLSENTLKADKELEKKVKAFTRRMEMRTESRRTQATQIID